MACDLELVSLALVSSVVLFLFPFFKIFRISLLEFVIISVTLFIIIPLIGSSLNSKYSLLFLLLDNKSLMFSLYISIYHNFIKYSLVVKYTIFLKSSFIVKGMIPGFSSSPNIVYVFPAPVAP